MGGRFAQAAVDATVTQTADRAIPETGEDWGEAHEWYWQGLSCHWRLLGAEGTRPLVLLHGFGASSAHWRHNAAPLKAAGFRIYSLDLIGFGASAQPGLNQNQRLDNRLWGKQLAAFLEQIVKANSCEQAVLIGNSLGGLTALTTAAFRPDLVAAVIAAPLPDPTLVQPVTLRQPRWWRRLWGNLITIIFRLLPLELIVPLIAHTPLIKAALQMGYHHSINSDHELLRLIANPARRPTAARALRAMCIGMALRPHGATAPELLKRLDKLLDRPPLLLIWGREDHFVPLKVGQRLQHQYPWIKLSVLDETGHCPHDESTQEFHQTVLSWLNINLVKD
ncbi:MAG TPA: alpha/beta fold hydrolase [Prochlorococcus sp.]